MRTLFAALALLSIPLGAAACTGGQVSVVVPFAPGQTGDIVARLVTRELQNRLGQTFVVDNRAGGGGRLGTGFVARAKADGCTLLLTSSGPFAIAPALYPKDMAYDPPRDFAGIAELASTPQVIVASPQSGLGSFNELVTRTRGADLSYGSAGNGSLQHLTMEILKAEIRFPMVHVPFKGSSESRIAVVGNTLPVSADSLPAVYGSLKAGQLKALAVVDDARSPYLPDVPTVAELGYPKLSAVSFFGLVAPKATPRPWVARLGKEVLEIMKTPVFRERLREQALTPSPDRTPEQFDAYLAAEVQRWKQLVAATGVRVEP